MLRIAEAVEEADGETLWGGGVDLGGCAGKGILVQGSEDAAVYVEPLHRFETKIGLHQWMRALLMESVKIGPVLASDLDDVDETGGGQEGGAGTAAFEQGVGGDGCAVHELGVDGRVICGGGYYCRGSYYAQVCQSGEDRAALVCGRGGIFVDLQTAVLQQDEVGECSAYIDSNQGGGHCGGS